MKKRLLALIAAGLLAVPFAAQATNLLVNGSFETGDTTGWTLTNADTNFTGVFCNSGVENAENGSCYFANGNYVSDGAATLAQSFTDVSGTNYQLSFWLLAKGDNPSSLVYGIQPASAPDPSVGLTNPDTGGVWTHYAMNFLGTGNDTVQFAGYDNFGFWYLDNVSVMAAVPEPPTLALFGLGLLGIGVMSRKRKARKS